MMRLIGLLTPLFFSTFVALPSRAQASTALHVVKVYSKHCQRPDKDFRGSGLLFKRGNADRNLYILTSEHVLLHGQKNTQICHGIGVQLKSNNEQFTKFEAALLASDWQEGLALLKITDPTPDLIEIAPDVSSIFSNDVEIGADFVVNGRSL